MSRLILRWTNHYAEMMVTSAAGLYLAGRMQVRMLSIDRSDLKRGLAEDEIVPFVQPLVDLRSGELVGFEALARWLHPQAGLLLPADFMAIAHHPALLGKLTERIATKACRAAASWPDTLLLSINIAPIQLRDRQFPAKLARIAAAAGFPMRRLIVEITETGIIGSYDQTRIACEALKRLGALIALDDFGTGYSSLTHLNELPLDMIKIDASFVRSIVGRRESRKIVAALLGLGHSLELRTVAEGIEHEVQADMLRLLGCQVGQGWLFGKPIPLHEAPARIAEPAWNAPLRLTHPNSSEKMALTLQAVEAQQVSLLRAIYDGSPVGLCFIDREQRCMALNNRLVAMTGLPFDAQLGRTLTELRPKRLPEHNARMLRALAGEEGIEYDIKLRDAAGVRRTCLISLQPVRDAAGDVAGVSCAVIDISEQVAATARLRESEDHYRHMVELSPHIPWTADPAGNIIDISTRWKTLTGKSREAALGTGWTGVVHPDDIAAARAVWAHSVASRAPHDIEFRILAHDGAYRWMRARATPRFDANREIVCWYGLTEDIHEQTQWRAISIRGTQAEFDAAIAASEQVFCLASIEIDGFHDLAAKHGSVEFERVLTAMAERLTANIRRLDRLVHLGADVFCVCMPLMTLADALATTERLRRVIGGTPFETQSGAILVSVSIGVAVAEPTDPAPDAVLTRAAKARHRARIAGGDQVAVDG